MSVLSRDGILSILDEGSRAFVFPMLDNGYVYLAASRLSLFRSPADWAMKFEIFGFSPRGGMPDLNVTTFGSAILQRKAAADFASEEAYRNFLASNRYWQQEFFFPIEDEGWIDADNSEEVDLAATHLMLRGQQVALPSAVDYAGAHIEWPNPSRPSVAEMCRTLAASHRNSVLATEYERRVSLPADMVQLLVLDDWQHPDICDVEELPSRSTTFRQLADALVAEDAAMYHPQPSNTHWSNWPDGGAL